MPSETIWYIWTSRIWTWRKWHILQKGFQCKWMPKNDQEGEKMALDILKTTTQYCCALKQEENKKYKIVYFLSFRDMSFRDDDSISLRSQLIVYVVFIQLIFIIWKGRVVPSFNIKTPVLFLLTLIECSSKPEGPFYSVSIIPSVTLSSLTDYGRSTMPRIII